MPKQEIARILGKFFEKKKKEGRAISIRGLANKVGLSSTYVHQILRGDRIALPSVYEKLCELLDIDSENRDLIVKRAIDHKGVGASVSEPLKRASLAKSVKRDDWSMVAREGFKFLNSWYFIPILECTRLKDYDGSVEFVAKTLKIPHATVVEAFREMTEAGYLILRDGVPVKQNAALNFNSRTHKDEIRRYHQNNLQLAIANLKKKTSISETEERLITSMTFICKKEEVPLIKQKIAAFMEELSLEYSDDDADSVHHLGVQLFRMENVEGS